MHENYKREEANQETKILDKEEAFKIIAYIRQEMYTMGANDYEFGAVDRILKDLEEDKIEPDKAVEEVRKIRNSKQDYH